MFKRIHLFTEIESYLQTGRRVFHRAELILTAGILLLLIMPGCSTDDDRDLCCEEVVLTYRYIRQDRDEYKEFVREMRHFLFGENGLFIRELPSDPILPQRLSLTKLPQGRYTVVTVGNATEGSSLLSTLVAESTHLRDFKLSVVKQFGSEILDNGDELFWNVRSFVAERNKQYRHVCDLSNIHCHLYVKIRWNKRPPFSGNKYTMQLEGVPVRNTLDPEKTHTFRIIRPSDVPGTESTEHRVVHTFSGLDSIATHGIANDLYGITLYGEFVTLRYTNMHIPTFRLYYGNQSVSKPINLSNVFSRWGWRPDEHPEQIYRIDMEIFDNGTVVVNQWAQTSVKDWEDGGTVSNNISN